MGGREAFYTLIIRSQSYGYPLALNYELDQCFSVSCTLDGTGWLEGIGVGYSPFSQLN